VKGVGEYKMINDDEDEWVSLLEGDIGESWGK
jgi:hypothetical protein